MKGLVLGFVLMVSCFGSDLIAQNSIEKKDDNSTLVETKAAELVPLVYDAAKDELVPEENTDVIIIGSNVVIDKSNANNRKTGGLANLTEEEIKNIKNDKYEPVVSYEEVKVILIKESNNNDIILE